MKLGWVIRSESYAFKKALITFWYGPDHGWGMTWGSLADAHVTRTKKQIEKDIESVYGHRWRSRDGKRELVYAQKYEEAFVEQEKRLAREHG